MKYGWRERVSGAVILVALAVIFVPMLFDDPPPRSDRPQPVLTIEQPVEVERREVEEPQPPASLDERGLPQAIEESRQPSDEEMPAGEVASESPQPDPIAELARAADQRLSQESASSAEAPQPAATQAPQPAAPAGEWAVQVGSFGEPANAERLQVQLREQGFNAYSRPRDNNLTSVYVGPYASSEAGERALDELKSRANLQGLLVRVRN